MKPETARVTLGRLARGAGNMITGAWLRSLEEWSDEHAARLVIVRAGGVWNVRAELAGAVTEAQNHSLQVAAALVVRQLMPMPGPVVLTQPARKRPGK